MIVEGTTKLRFLTYKDAMHSKEEDTLERVLGLDDDWTEKNCVKIPSMRSLIKDDNRKRIRSVYMLMHDPTSKHGEKSREENAKRQHSEDERYHID
jgi:hypothetical protein